MKMRCGLYAAVCVVCVQQVLAANPYKGGEYRTRDSYLYGRFEVRMKTAQREGMLTSFFTYNDMVPFDSEQWNEIDIEVMGRYTDDVQFNTITPGQISHVGRRRTPFNPSLGFHTYAIEWTPAYVAWFIDGVEAYRQTGAQIQTLIHAQKIMMNVWIQSAVNWSGQWNETSLPVFAYYDYVSYSSYTPGAGSGGSGNNFTMQWTDDLTAYDPARWERATHTFGGNLCDFVPENIVFRDGMMVICLTTASALGYQDTAAPFVTSIRADADGLIVSYSEEVDSVSATDAANYIVSDNTVTSAVLYSDKRTVCVTIAGYETAVLSNVVVRNVKDRFNPANRVAVRSITIQKPSRLAFPVKINCGGPAVNGYLADQAWNASLEYGHLDGGARQNSATVSGVNDPAVFRTELNGAAEYRVRVPNGTYLVTLLMSENYFLAAGKRLFDIAVQGTVVETNLDLFVKAGPGVQYQRIVHDVKVTEGILDIHFMSLLDFAVINAISIITVPTTGVAEAPTAPRDWNVGQNFPNPFNGSTVIPFSVTDGGPVSIRFFDVLGRCVGEHALGGTSAGKHVFKWNARDADGRPLPSGPYYYVVSGVRSVATRKMLLLQ